ncbi:MAG: alpha/beta hydrolase-fold protein [Thermoplasmata archaeon]
MLPPPGTSRRLAAFSRAVRRDGPRSLDRHWATLTKEGLPLVERVLRDPQTRLVTFVWRPGRTVTGSSIDISMPEIVLGDSTLRQVGHLGVWFRSFRFPRRTRTHYGFSPRPLPGLKTSDKAWARYLKSVVPDPCNSRAILFERDPDDPDDVPFRLSVIELPGAPPQPWSRTKGPLRWTQEHHRLDSRFLRTPRSVWVYLPADFDPGRRGYNLLIAFDGVIYRSAIPTPRIVQNLVAARKIAPTVVVLVGNAPGARGKELTCNPGFADFLGRELLPWMRRRYRLRMEPSKTVLAGSSLGGVAAAYTALRYPHLVGNVLAQSGAFQVGSSGSRSGPSSLMHEFALAPKFAIKFYLDAGKIEGTTFPGLPVSLLGSVRHMRDVLMAKGYSVSYAEFDGGHDYACWNGTFADGLIHLLGK